MSNQRVDTLKAAGFLGLKKGTLEVWRSLGKGPRYKKIGRKVFYDVFDLETFANAHTVETIDSISIRNLGVKNERH